ncbi:MAG TPA: ceramidase domain-containing protein [Burkholderiaceae bacterium]|nr:ceramidase domain-containing protein [Burkholderiaceae bacterium]
MTTAARPWHSIAFVAFTLACVAAAFLLPAMPQPTDYHAFVDDRTLFGVPHFKNVVSNLAFVLAGAAGFVVMARSPAAFIRPAERWPYYVFFAGLALTGLGSAYYHLDPDNETLFWDRLPMTIAFAGLVAGQIAERMNPRLGVALLTPMLAIGAASVFYWRATERAGAGNVLPYAILQGYTMAAVLLLAFTHPSRYTRGSDIYWVFAAYLAAKVTETLDAEIWEWTAGLISGHTLKHLFAALSGVIVCVTLLRRRPVAGAAA